MHAQMLTNHRVHSAVWLAKAVLHGESSKRLATPRNTKDKISEGQCEYSVVDLCWWMMDEIPEWGIAYACTQQAPGQLASHSPKLCGITVHSSAAGMMDIHTAEAAP